MQASDWIAISAALTSLVALAIGIYNRRADIAMHKANARKARVWEVLNGETGTRSIYALDVDDGQTGKRIVLLHGTAGQLDVANASSLANQLRDLLSKPWGAGTTGDSREARDAFLKAVTAF
jgi:hypothetical protein